MFNRVYRHFGGLSRTASPLSPLSPVGVMAALRIGKPQMPLHEGWRS